MKHNIKNIIFCQCRTAMLIAVMLVCSIAAHAQITQVHGTVSDEFGALLGATVCEVDKNGRIIESAITDLNGNFSMQIKNAAKDRLRVSYVGLKTQFLKIDKTQYDIVMASATQLEAVVVQGKNRSNVGLPIPEREISYAHQGINSKDFEGLGINTIDEALQGRIAGLDIVGASGNLGSGSVMRLRGATSLSSSVDQNPLVVVDGNERDVDMSSFDANSTDMNEQMAQLLNINTEDIEDLQVLLDGAGAAIYGSKGSNGVILIRTKRGARGKPRLTYSLKLKGTYQPKGMDMLSGDDYTMLLKEEYFNPAQNDAASSGVNEINYLDRAKFADANMYDDNTDWRSAVTKFGLQQNHYLTIAGGGERAQFRISGGYDHVDYCVIGQKMNRFSTRVNLDYNVSNRIRVQTNFSMMYTKYNHNSDDLISIAQKKMPNMSIYQEDADGNDLSTYYNMPQSGAYIGNDIFKDDQRTYVNPVASGYLAKNINTQYDLTPELVLNYELLGLDDDHTRLKYRGSVYMNIFNNYTNKFYPTELVSTVWSAGHNESTDYSSKRMSLTTKHELTFTPVFKNRDHSAMAMIRMELNTGSSTSQNTNGTGLPSDIESPNAGGLVVTPQSSTYNDWRSLAFTFTSHYAYLGGRYGVDFTLRADGTTKLGPNKRWVYTPAVSLRWNIIDEPFMKNIREKGTLSMLSLRPSWSLQPQQPNGYFLYTSKYYSGTSYMGMGSMYPSNMKLSNLSCEKINNFNFGSDIGFFNDRLTTAFEVFVKTRSDMLMGNYRIASNTGFSTVGSYNTGKMRTVGWSFRLNGNQVVKAGKFSMDAYLNLSNERSTLLEMDENVLKAMNTSFNNTNNQILTRVQVNNPLNGIYGFRSKGVYQYQYETIKNMTITSSQAAAAGITGWDDMTKAEKQQAWIDAGKTAPVALNADGQIIRDNNGDPLQMRFAYTNDGTGVNDADGTAGYEFKGGDAIYEDINHDGQINALDIVYLGSSLPKLYGGFGLTFRYNKWRLSANFNYRVGVDIINRARLYAEAMTGNINQSQAVNYRWRKEGDVTTIPRAMYGTTSNYNTLMSDRFVEDGSYLRLGFLQLSYTLSKNQLKRLGLGKIALFLSGDNLFILTKYKGVDPDISASGYSPAVDNGQTPRARSFTFGMTVDF